MRLFQKARFLFSKKTKTFLGFSNSFWASTKPKQCHPATVCAQPATKHHETRQADVTSVMHYYSTHTLTCGPVEAQQGCGGWNDPAPCQSRLRLGAGSHWAPAIAEAFLPKWGPGTREIFDSFAVPQRLLFNDLFCCLSHQYWLQAIATRLQVQMLSPYTMCLNWRGMKV